MAGLPYDLQNRDIAIRTILSEDQTMDGSAGVAAVILNRMASGRYGSTIDDVTTAQDQFEGLYDAAQKARRGEPSVLDISTDDPRYIRVGQTLDAIATGAMPDPTNGATHFFGRAAQSALGRAPPSWGVQPGQMLGGSEFYAPEGRVSYQALSGVARQPYHPSAAGLREADLPSWMKDYKISTQAPPPSTAAASKPQPSEGGINQSALPDWMKAYKVSTAPPPQPARMQHVADDTAALEAKAEAKTLPGPLHDRAAVTQPPAPDEGYFAPEKRALGMIESDPLGFLKKLGPATLEEAKGIVSPLGVVGDVAQGKASMSDPGTQQRAIGAASLAAGGLAGDTALPPRFPPLLEAEPASRADLGLERGVQAKPDGQTIEGETPPGLNMRVEAEPGPSPFPEHLSQFKPSLRQAREPDGSEPAPGGAPQKPSSLPPHLDEHKPSKRATAAEPSAQPVGAAVAPKPVIPPEPPKQWVGDLEARLNRVRGNRSADRPDLMQTYVDPLPPEFKNPEVQAKWDAYGQGDPNANLTVEEVEGFNKYMRPVLEEQERNYVEAMDLKKKYGAGVEEDDVNPNYMRRNVKGMSPQFDPRDEGQINPIGGRRSLPQSTSSMKERKFFTIQDDAGKRMVVAHLSDGDWMVIEKGHSYPIDLPKDMKLGQTHIEDGTGRRLYLTNAFTREITAVGGPEYYENAMANAVDNIARQRAVLDGLYEYKNLTQSPEWLTWARSVGGNQPIPEGYRIPKMQLFHHWYVDPRLADALDNFAGDDPALGNIIAGANRIALRTMFWNPTAHELNVFMHWAPARSFDWIRPQGMRSLIVDGGQAFKSVWGMDKTYQEVLREGGGLLYSGVINQDFYGNLMRALGDDIVRNPSKWKEIADNYGLGIPQLARAWYGCVQRALWYGSDVMVMQRVLELKGLGMTTREAVEEVHRHIPSYQVPSRIAENIVGAHASRLLSRVMQDQSLSAFGRYHYGMMRSWSNATKDLFGKSAKDALGRSRRIEGIGTLLVIGGLMAFVNPLMQSAWRSMTGSKDDKWKARGPTALSEPIVDSLMQGKWVKKHAPAYLVDYYDGNTDIMQALGNLMIVAPEARFLLEISPILNKSMFTGEPVAQPDDVNNLRIPRVLGEWAAHFAQTNMQPYEFEERARKMAQSKDPMGVINEIVEQFGKSALNVTTPNKRGIEAVKAYQAKDAAKNTSRDTDPLFRAGNALQDYWDNLFR